jgi:hypothetical protein
MPGKTDVPILKANSVTEVQQLAARFKAFEQTLPYEKYALLRWAASMTIVELHAVWERYAETRLVKALNHHPQSFIERNEIQGVHRIPHGLANVLVRGNSKFFDFRSVGELIDKGNKLLDLQNPFLSLKRTTELTYLETMTAIRNCVVHNSEVSLKSYKRSLRDSFGVKSAPSPDEFLNAIDNRLNSPLRGEKRIFVLAQIVISAISLT